MSSLLALVLPVKVLLKILLQKGITSPLSKKAKDPSVSVLSEDVRQRSSFMRLQKPSPRSQHLQDLGITTQPQVDWQQILQEKNAFTSRIPENTVKNLRGSGIIYLEGGARFIDKSNLQAGEQTIHARYFIIAAGAKPVDLQLEGKEFLVTCDDLLELGKLPPRIAFIGGGFISFEFAHFGARLGSERGRCSYLRSEQPSSEAF